MLKWSAGLGTNMKKISIILIVIGLLVVVGANLFLDAQPEPATPPVRDNTLIRTTSSGDVVGFRDRFGARSWQGIPYAAPPTGANRWRAPQPPLPHQAVLETLAPGQMCTQLSSALSGEQSTPGAITGGEDCLYLNIWAPPNAVDLPVMYWIHGGGNSIGDGGSYSGAALATKRDVVVVTLNYRLGLFGWFSHPGLISGNAANDSGNYGTLDTIAGLKWVKDNITEFGGNPKNITVFGESAGAFNTLALMASPLAKDLFHRAIVQSGGFEVEPMTRAQNYVANGGHRNSAKEVVARMLVQDGTVADLHAARIYQSSMSQNQIRAYLYDKPMQEFFTPVEGGGFGMLDLPYNLGDGHVLPQLSTREIFSQASNHNTVPVILGTNRDEPALFMVRNPAFVKLWLGFLPRMIDESLYVRTIKYGALAWKERGVDRLANYMRASGNPDVYAYRFDWDEEPSQAGFDLSVALGAAHGLEINFAFGDFDSALGISDLYPHDAAQQALSDSMTSYWSEFAYRGDPGTGRNGREVQWLAWGDQGMRSIILDSPADQGIFMDDTEVTIASIKAELAADKGFSRPEEQCAVYARNFRHDNFSLDEYRALNDACADIDPAELTGPW